MPLSIAVCIPCAPKDIKYLKYCLASVQAQTRPADAVIVSISSTPDPSKVLIDLSGITIPLDIIYTATDKYAGANRNIAAKKAVENGADILSFFDADDIMHPRRLERIEDIFLKHPGTTALVHSLIMGKRGDMDMYEGKEKIPWNPITNDYISEPFVSQGSEKCYLIKFQQSYRKLLPAHGEVHNGHVSVLSSYWLNNPYNEEMKLGQDSHFTGTLLRSKHKLDYTGDCLSLYMGKQ
jgi:glycosyltransferase involved in cell wall biosynthesis